MAKNDYGKFEGKVFATHPTKAIMGAGVLKIPEPMILLITMAVDSLTPKSFLYSTIESSLAEIIFIQ